MLKKCTTNVLKTYSTPNGRTSNRSFPSGREKTRDLEYPGSTEFPPFPIPLASRWESTTYLSCLRRRFKSPCTCRWGICGCSLGPSRVDPRGTEGPKFRRLSEKLKEIGIQGVRPLTQEEAATFQKEATAEDYLAVLTSLTDKNEKDVRILREYFCTWCQFNGHIVREIHSGHEEFFLWLGCKCLKAILCLLRSVSPDSYNVSSQMKDRVPS